MDDVLIIPITRNKITTNIASHDYLSQLANHILETRTNELIIDMRNVTYVSSNQFAVLGCIFDTFKHSSPKTKLSLRNVSFKLHDLILKNGFCSHFGFEKTADTYNTVIPYRYFSVTDIEEYERYLFLYLFSRADLPLMTDDVRNTISDYLLEVFKNVVDHTSSFRIYTCGQFFPKSSMLYFTVVDSGETIPYNVNRFFNLRRQSVPNDPLHWALQEGHSTSDDGPRGIGLSLIKEFIKLNNGNFYIVSGQHMYEINCNKEHYRRLNSSFPGTIVTLGFNLKDNAIYCMDSGSIQDIQF